MSEFTGNLIKNLQEQTIEEYIFYSLNTWKQYIEDNNLLDEYIVEFLLDKENKKEVKEFVDDKGILDLEFSQNKITKRLIIGFDSYISIRKDLDINFRDYFKEYDQYLKNTDINNALKLKIIIYEISKKIKTVPRLAMYDTMSNAGTAVGYNIRYYNKDIAENIYVDIRCAKKLGLTMLSDDRDEENLEDIRKEIQDIEKLLLNGLFNLIVHDDYPKSLEPILPEEVYKAQIEDRIFKDQVEVKYQGKTYKAIEVKDSYIALDQNLHVEKDQEKAKTIYCKASLRESFLF